MAAEDCSSRLPLGMAGRVNMFSHSSINLGVPFAIMEGASVKKRRFSANYLELQLFLVTFAPNRNTTNGYLKEKED